MMVKDRNFRAGDILVACDNAFNIPHGYWGHAAIMANENQVLEATDSFPYIRVLSIEQFMQDHPNHAQYRPKDPMVGANAAACAVDYLEKYRQNVANGQERPVFSFFGPSPLSDPWQTVYCSKLVWLSYYYGTGIKFPNDYFLFTPEDLDTVLKKDDRFTLIYRHPDFQFLINT